MQELIHHDEGHLLSLIKEMIAAQLVVEESVEQFAFRHALTRQAIYTDLLVRERKALHRSIAGTMERLYHAAPETHLADLAYHFYEAGSWEKALLYARRAAELAQSMYAPRTAVEQVTRTLDAVQRGLIPPPIALYHLRGQVHEILGDFDRALLDFETCLQMAHDASDLETEWQALHDLGFLWTGYDYNQAGRYFQQALTLARGMDDPLTMAHSLNRLGNWHVNIEQPGEALRYHLEALAQFQQVHVSPGIAETYDLLGLANALGGDFLQGTTYYQQAIALFQELDERQGLASSLSTVMTLGGRSPRTIRQCGWTPWSRPSSRSRSSRKRPFAP